MLAAHSPWQLRLYEVTSLAISPLVLLHLLRRRVSGLERDLGHRLGLGLADAMPAPHRRGPLRPVWLHGSSVGEGLSALALARLLAQRNPHLHFLITSGTVDGVDVVHQQLDRASCGASSAARDDARVTCVQAPADLPFAVWAFRRRWQPSALIVLEADLWPSMLAQCARSGIPLALVDGRISERSAKRWGSWLLRPLIAYLLARFGLVLCQSTADKARLEALGASEASYVGSIKGAAGPLPVNSAAVSAVQEALSTSEHTASANEHVAGAVQRQRRVWLAASTHDKEEELAALAHEQVLALSPAAPSARPLLVIIPRHPKRSKAVVQMLARRHARWRVVLHSKMANMRVLAAADVLVVDALGVMGDWYAVADVAFVGGSLVDGVGGHNVMEPALLGCMPVCGPYTENGQHLIDALRSVDPAAICQVRSPSELSAAVVQVLRSVRHVDEGSYSPVRSAAQAAAEQVVLRSRLVLADAVDQFLAKQC